MCLAVPCRVTRVLSAAAVEVDRQGERLCVSTLLLDEQVAAGDWVAVQAQRQAVARLSAAEAAEILALFDALARGPAEPAR